MIEHVLNVFAPHHCCSCGEKGAILCEYCKENIISEPFSGCLLCQKPCGELGLCAICRKATGIQQGWCVGERRDTLKQLGDAYKFENMRAGAIVLAELLDSVVPVLPPEVVVTPVPTSPATIRIRGFDHAFLIAKNLAKRRNLLVTRLLERVSRETLHFLDRHERERLAPTLFALRLNIPIPQHVILVDDIVTTGTTVRAATKILREAGVERVDVAVIARQPFE